MIRRKKDGKLPNPINYSLWLLNYKPRSIKEMTLALKKRGFSSDVVDETIDSLLRWKYLDDDAYKHYLIEKRKKNNPKGRVYVSRELADAGVACGFEMEDLYTDEEEQECIRKLLLQWQRSGEDFAENRNRYFQRLYRRGFTVANIRSELGKYEEFSENDFD